MQTSDTTKKDWLLVWNAECLESLSHLQNILQSERMALVSLDFDAIVKSTAEKNAILNRIQEKRRQMRKLAQVRYGDPSLEKAADGMAEPLLTDWKESYKAWRDRWEEMKRICEANQGFLNHSVRNIGMLLDNLKGLFGQQGVYSSKGLRSGMNVSGKVLEGKF